MDNINFLMYKTEDGETKIDVCLEEESVWMTQKSIAELYQKGLPTINEHIKKYLQRGRTKRTFNTSEKPNSSK